MNIKILLVDDQNMNLESVKRLIQQESDMEVVAEAAEGNTAIKYIRRFIPDVVIMDVIMPQQNGMSVTKMILKEFPKMRVLGLSMHSDKRFITGMLDSGATGYVLKDNAFKDLVNAIRGIMENKIYLGSGIFL